MSRDEHTPETLASVARALFGVPDKNLSTENRLVFGSIEFNVGTGAFYDREAEEAIPVVDLVGRRIIGMTADQVAERVHERAAQTWLRRFLQDEVYVEATDLPPELQLERDLLGLVLARREVVGWVEEEIGPTDFLSYTHGRLFAACIEAREQNFQPTLETLLKAMNQERDEEIFPGFTAAKYLGYLIRTAPIAVDVEASAEGVTIEMMARNMARQVRQLGEIERGDTPPEMPEEAPPPPRVSKFGLVMWRDQLVPGEQYEYIIEDLIPAKEPVLIFGETQSGKSFYTMDMGVSLARGVHFFDRRVLKPMGVVYCAYEAGKGYKNRMRAYTSFHGLAADDIPFAVLTKPIDLWSAPVNVDHLIDEIRWIVDGQFRGVQLGAVVIDTHNAATPGASEIDSKEVSAIRDRYSKIREKCDCGVWIVGHKNKAGAHRGNEQLMNNIETAIDISRKMESDGGKALIPVRDASHAPIRVARIVKQREGADGIQWEFVLGNMVIGENAYGRPRTSCVVLTPSREASSAAQGPGIEAGQHASVAAKVQRQALTADELVILQAMRDAQTEHGVNPHNRDDMATISPSVARKLVTLPTSIARVVEWRHVRDAYKAKCDPDLTAEAFDKRLSRAGTRFLSRGLVGRVNPFIWVIPRRERKAAEAATMAPKEDPDLPLLAPGEARGDNWGDHL